MSKDKTATLTYMEGLSTVDTFAGEYATHQLLPFDILVVDQTDMTIPQISRRFSSRSM